MPPLLPVLEHRQPGRGLAGLFALLITSVREVASCAECLLLAFPVTLFLEWDSSCPESFVPDSETSPESCSGKDRGSGQEEQY